MCIVIYGQILIKFKASRNLDGIKFPVSKSIIKVSDVNLQSLKSVKEDKIYTQVIAVLVIDEITSR